MNGTTELFNIAQNVEAFEFAIVNGALVTAELKEKVQLFAPHLTAPVVADRAEVDEAFLYANGYDVVFEYQREDWTRISQSKGVLTITVFDYSDEALKTSVIAALRAVSADFPAVALSYGDTKSWGPSASNMGATGTKYPTVIAVTTPKHTGSSLQLVWNEETEFNEANLRVWLASILDGSVVPFKKSEALPESNDGPVKILVHKNFDQITTANNVFVEFYAPWCGHCKSLAPIWDQLGQHFKDAKTDVTIAKIDATANYVDGSFGVTGFPTLIFLKADGTRVPYKGGRTFDELVAFVNEQVPAPAAAAATEDAHAGHSHNAL
jgi:protein disulfide-isomerase A1